MASQPSASTNASAPSTATSAASSMTSYFQNKGTLIFSGITGVISLILFSMSFYVTADVWGSIQDFNSLKPQLVKIVGLTLGGMLAFYIAFAMFFKQMQDSDNMYYIILAMTCLSLGLSYGALVASAMSR